MEKTSKTTKFNLQTNSTMPTRSYHNVPRFLCLRSLFQCLTTLSLVLPGRRSPPPPCCNLLPGTCREQCNCSRWVSNRRRHIRTEINTSRWPHWKFPKSSSYLFFIDNVAKRKWVYRLILNLLSESVRNDTLSGQ